MIATTGVAAAWWFVALNGDLARVGPQEPSRVRRDRAMERGRRPAEAPDAANTTVGSLRGPAP